MWLPARLDVAATLASIGQLDEALEEQRKIMKLPGAPAVGWLKLARWLTRKNLRLEPSERDWEEVEKALDQAAGADPEAIDVSILRAEVLVAQDRVEEAEKMLSEARDKKPDQPVFWIALAGLAQRQGQWERGAQILQEAEQKLGDIVPLRLARARYLAQRHGGEASQQVRKLAEKSQRFSREDLLQLRTGLVGASLRIGDDEQAERLCQLLSKEDPNNLRIRLLLFELALRAKDASGMERILKEIERIEGKGPIWHFGWAARLVVLAGDGREKVLDEAQKHLAEARKLRPKWSRVPALAGEIHELQGNQEAAMENYRQAIELGGQNTRSIRRMAQLLYQQKRYLEAHQMIRRLEEQQRSFPLDLGRMASELSLRLEDFDRSVEMARRVASDSEDYHDHLWLGQVLAILGQSPGEGGVGVPTGLKQATPHIESGGDPSETLWKPQRPPLGHIATHLIVAAGVPLLHQTAENLPRRVALFPRGLFIVLQNLADERLEITQFRGVWLFPPGVRPRLRLGQHLPDLPARPMKRSSDRSNAHPVPMGYTNSSAIFHRKHPLPPFS